MNFPIPYRFISNTLQLCVSNFFARPGSKEFFPFNLSTRNLNPTAFEYSLSGVNYEVESAVGRKPETGARASQRRTKRRGWRRFRPVSAIQFPPLGASDVNSTFEFSSTSALIFRMRRPRRPDVAVAYHWRPRNGSLIRSAFFRSDDYSKMFLISSRRANLQMVIITLRVDFSPLL